MQSLRLPVHADRVELGFTLADKQLAVVLYLHGLSMRAVAKLLGTTATSVMKWVRAAGQVHGQRPDPEPGGAVIVELDEPERSGDGRSQMWHYLKKSPQTLGLESPLPGKWTPS